MMLVQLTEMDEFWLWNYESVDLYKEKMMYHDKKIEKKNFTVGDLALLFNLRFKIYIGKLK